MKRIVIADNQRGLLFKRGRYVKMLKSGVYTKWGSTEIQVQDLYGEILPERCTLDTLLADPAVKSSVATVEVGDREYALHFVNGKFRELLTSGKHAFWSVFDSHTFQIVDISKAEVDESVPSYIFSMIPSFLYKEIIVPEYHKSLLYIDQKFQRVLDSGVYYFWNNASSVDTLTVCTRAVKQEINGQEMLTLDKVSVRVNLVYTYRVTDPVGLVSSHDSFEEAIYLTAQLALRDYVGAHRLDELLESKDLMSSAVFDALKSCEISQFVEFTGAGVKDLILPGEIREIMNTVLVAEKRAQANVIARREEVASTRSLLNTAKLMEENATLYKLKELEFIERICENVGSINLNGNTDLVTLLSGLVGKKAE
ncbi:MAG: slipin family protein [Clostridia bacterium]|nr:slipin family protein [Clostridia bacterium]